MGEELHDLDVLALDCQASGATPAYGDLIELGWARCGARGIEGPLHSHWLVPRTERRISRAVRELTGWAESCLEQALPEEEAYRALLAELGERPQPTVIHYARFELPFLRDLHARLGDGEFPFDVVDLHAVAARLFPNLPRRNIRALAGFLGHAPELLRRCGGHVEATAFIWKALLPELAQRSVRRWSELKTWLESAPSVKRTRRVFPLAAERRRSLPDAPGVYRFVRKNGDIIYVGKAASLRKRVASHFAGGARATERSLEMLTQVADIAVSPTASILEAALLECDEIKRIDPPYNVQLRRGERSAWYAARDLWETRPSCDEEHRVGPLPSSKALLSYAALVSLAKGEPADARLCSLALAVPLQFRPDEALFQEGWSGFVSDHLCAEQLAPARRLHEASRALWLARGRSEPDASPEDAPPDFWDLARVRRRLERNLVQGGLLLRRARWLRLLAEAELLYRESAMPEARYLRLDAGHVVAGETIDRARLAAIAARRPRVSRCEHRTFDAATYDRLRVVATELRRVLDEGGVATVRLGHHVFEGERLARLLQGV
jgi:DNA polymerase III subunit epsilon